MIAGSIAWAMGSVTNSLAYSYRDSVTGVGSESNTSSVRSPSTTPTYTTSPDWGCFERLRLARCSEAGG